MDKSISTKKIRKAFNVKSISKMGLFLSLLICSGFLTINFGFVNFTLQIAVVFLICLFLSLKEGLVVILSYIILGLIGLPIFASFQGGFSYVLAPTFGFVYGFIFGLFSFHGLSTILSKKLKNDILVKIVSLSLALLVVYLIGFIHGLLIFKYYLNIDKDFLGLLLIIILPYIPFDIAKLISVIIVYKVYKMKS